MDVSAPRLRADAARNRAQILHVARADVEAGDLSLNLNDIARRAGVGVGTVYRHFPTRELLLMELVMFRFDELCGVAIDARHHTDPWKALEEFSRAAVTTMLSDPAFTEMLAQSCDLDKPQTELAARLLGTMDELMARAIAAGAVRADMAPADLLSLLYGVISAAHIGSGDSIVLADRYLTVMLSGLRTK